MALRALLVATACLVLASPASGITRTVITERDSGTTFRIRLGGEMTLRLTERYRWSGPKIQGAAIRLIPVNYVRDPGFHEWVIRARARGTASITAVGYSASRGGSCDPGPCRPRLFRIAIVVR
jgi:predicted secreted protein